MTGIFLLSFLGPALDHHSTIHVEYTFLHQKVLIMVLVYFQDTSMVPN